MDRQTDTKNFLLVTSKLVIDNDTDCKSVGGNGPVTINRAGGTFLKAPGTYFKHSKISGTLCIIY